MSKNVRTERDEDVTETTSTDHSEAPTEQPSTDSDVIPVIRPAVVAPNPDASAPQTAPVYEEPEPVADHDPVPTSVLSSTTTDLPSVTPRDSEDQSERGGSSPEKTSEDQRHEFDEWRRPATDPQPIVPAGYASETETEAEPSRRRFPGLPTWKPNLGGRTRGGVFRKSATDTAPSNAAEDRHSFVDSIPTQALQLNNRLFQSPYQARRVANAGRDYRQVAENADVGNTLQFALRLGETMFRFGAGALEVETSIIVVTQAFGVPDAEIDITNQAISLNYVPAGETPFTYQRVVRSWSSNYAGLSFLHQLVTRIANGDATRDEAEAKLAEIRHQSKTFPGWVALLATGLFGTSFVMFIGGSPMAGLMTFFSMIMTMTAVDLMGRIRMPEVFATMTGGAVATGVALALYAFDVFQDPSAVIAGSLMMLLPALRIVSAVQDGINGFPMTAAGRMVSSLLSYIGLVAGIVVAVAISDLIGVPQIDLTRVPDYEYPVWLLALFVLMAALFAAMSDQSSVRLLLPTGLVSGIGYLAYVAGENLGLGPTVTPAFAAVAVGFLARIVALRLGAPQLVVAVPAIMFLLPGLMIFRSMYRITISAETVPSGLIGMFNAMVIILAMAFGSVLGDTLARPLTGRLSDNERRRIGRR
ncbi:MULTISPECIES: threonine/serine ThrE exporter family protein [Auritidibacter]|uniref:Threonine/serine exporter family protein n=1 Tax=Auritidibacter ignavus TaxID=678932 RepID=A0AAJ6ALI6_9MICC|nr:MULTISPECIES: threonine/serine exporter family protein [Auritidibacter]NIH71902.1 uncharacterized membrane protein YjjP (DUF1212 family) [Auritidibacter ignavus]PXA76298.1 hypothetical protein DCC24_08190 [Auritidibacter sp. NML100628]RMX22710.1 threonine/serine exporter family protein [Auritidibacter ignavus]WGH80549.1 threonine/serine exporter family protein [Auritidibacter ignavus]WGH85008.1 threonine/serine exporter family protein [Auritidibacter ignavus]